MCVFFVKAGQRLNLREFLNFFIFSTLIFKISLQAFGGLGVFNHVQHQLSDFRSECSFEGFGSIATLEEVFVGFFCVLMDQVCVCVCVC